MTTASHRVVVSQRLVIVQDEPSPLATLYHNVTVASEPASWVNILVQPAIELGVCAVTPVATTNISITSLSCTADGDVGLFTTGERVAVVKSVSPIARIAIVIQKPF